MLSPPPKLVERLRSVGLRLTRPRLEMARLIFDNGNRHFTAERLHDEAVAASIQVSLATVYNILHQFTMVGLLREVVVEPRRTYFDTNTDNHHHFFCEATGSLQDIAGPDVTVIGIPAPPAGTRIGCIEVVVRLHAEPGS